jgi:hypothetical protein
MAASRSMDLKEEIGAEIIYCFVCIKHKNNNHVRPDSGYNIAHN